MTKTLLPRAAVDRVAHEEQLRIWAHDLAVALGMGNYLSLNDYDEIVEVEALIRRELKDILQSAFDHPEAVTIVREGGV